MFVFPDVEIESSKGHAGDGGEWLIRGGGERGVSFRKWGKMGKHPMQRGVVGEGQAIYKTEDQGEQYVEWR